MNPSRSRSNRKCAGFARNGNPCRRYATEGLAHCPEHGGYLCHHCGTQGVIIRRDGYSYEEQTLCSDRIRECMHYHRIVEALRDELQEYADRRVTALGIPKAFPIDIVWIPGQSLTTMFLTNTS